VQSGETSRAGCSRVRRPHRNGANGLVLWTVDAVPWISTPMVAGPICVASNAGRPPARGMEGAPARQAAARPINRTRPAPRSGVVHRNRRGPCLKRQLIRERNDIPSADDDALRSNRPNRVAAEDSIPNREAGKHLRPRADTTPATSYPTTEGHLWCIRIQTEPEPSCQQNCDGRLPGTSDCDPSSDLGAGGSGPFPEP